LIVKDDLNGTRSSILHSLDIQQPTLPYSRQLIRQLGARMKAQRVLALRQIVARASVMASLLFMAACNTTTAEIVSTGSIGSSDLTVGRQFQRGQASWYGPGFHGRRTANGESFNSGAMTAAHRSLPFGARVRVVNESNGSSVVVRINDRGPFARGRVIDLARSPAQTLGLTSTGTAFVSLHRLD
jgi:rare lipoprotein A